MCSRTGGVVIVAHSLELHLHRASAAEVAARIKCFAGGTDDPERRAVLELCPVPAFVLPYLRWWPAATILLSAPAAAYARAWGSEFMRLPGADHLNVESGHGEWPLGLALLQSAGRQYPTSPETVDTSAAARLRSRDNLVHWMNF
jgi:hypothetical protein